MKPHYSVTLSDNCSFRVKDVPDDLLTYPCWDDFDDVFRADFA